MQRPRTVIRSATNSLLKRARAVLAGVDRERLILEGDRLVDDARASGVELEVVLVGDDREERAAALEAAELESAELESAELESGGTPVVRVARALLDRISALDAPPGILALGAVPEPPPYDALPAGPDALLLVVAGIANPGNLGALARTAEAAGAHGIAVLAGGVRPWNEKALRGSMGSLLRLPVWRPTDAAGFASALSERGYRQVAAATRGGTPLVRFDFRGPLALWIGAEVGDLPAVGRELERVTIPMRGRVESLNATVAASLLLYAAGRAEPREDREDRP